MRIEVNDAATGNLRYAADGFQESVGPILGVGADGLAVSCGPHDRLAWASASSPVPHTIGRLECSEDLIVAGRRVAYSYAAGNSVRVTDLAGHARSLLRSPAGFDFNGRRLLVGALGCGEDFVGSIGVSAKPYRTGRCHIRVIRVRRDAGRRTVAITVACRPGCQGYVDILLGHSGSSSGIPRALRIPRTGRRTVHVRLDSRARRRLRHYRAVPYSAEMSYTDPRDGSMFESITGRDGRLRGDGSHRFPPPPPEPPED
jgi:hypothetical protein